MRHRETCPGLAVSENQRNLVKALAATGKPVVLILNGGRPRIISDIEPLADAIVNILLPGNFGGDALANILAGDTNPSGKMPYTYPRHQAELTTYDYRVSEEMDKMEGAYDYDAVVSVQWPLAMDSVIPLSSMTISAARNLNSVLTMTSCSQSTLPIQVIAQAKRL